MPIIKLDSLMNETGILSVIFGLPGKGKTACIRNFPKKNTAIITSEPAGLITLQKFGWNEVNAWTPNTPSEYLSAVEEVLKNPDYKHIVIDTVSMYYEHLIKNYIDTSEKDVSKMGLDIYRVCNLRFQEALRNLIASNEYGKDVICLCHLSYREYEEGESKRMHTEPALPGQIPSWLCRQASLILRADNVRMGLNTKWMLFLDSGAGSYGKDIFGVVPTGSCDNDLWQLYTAMRQRHLSFGVEDKGTPYVPAPEPLSASPMPLEMTEEEAEKCLEETVDRAADVFDSADSPYQALLKLAAKCAVSPPLLNKFLKEHKCDPKVANIHQMRQVYVDFRNMYDLPEKGTKNA